MRIVSHSSCRTSAILTYFCPLVTYEFGKKGHSGKVSSAGEESNKIEYVETLIFGGRPDQGS